MQAQRCAGKDPERKATLRALAELRTGQWKAGKDDRSGLEKVMILALEAILSDRDPPRGSVKRRSRRAR